MAIAFDNAAALGSTTAASLTTAFTVGSGANRILFVATAFNGSVAEQVTAITYHGASLTKIDYATHTASACQLWYLLNPDSGSNNVVVSALGGTLYFAYASSYSGANQSGQPDANVKDVTSTCTPGGPGSNIINPAVVTIADNDWIITIADGPTWSGTSTDGNVRAFDATGGVLVDKGPVTPPASTTDEFDSSFSGGTPIASITAAFKPTQAAGGGVTTLSIQSSTLSILPATTLTMVGF